MPAVEAGLLTFDGRALGFRHELARLAVLESLPLLRVQELHERCSRRCRRRRSRACSRGWCTMRSAPAIATPSSASPRRRRGRRLPRRAPRSGRALPHRARVGRRSRDVGARRDRGSPVYECYLTGDIVGAARRQSRGARDVASAGRPRAIGRDIRWLSRLAWFLGDHAEARQRAKEALDVLAPLGEDEELAMALSNRAQLHMLGREHDPCIELGQRAIEMARRLGSVEVLSHALNNVGSSRASARRLPDGSCRKRAWRSRSNTTCTSMPPARSQPVRPAACTSATTRTPSDGSTPASTTRSSATSIRGGSTCSPGARGCSPKPVSWSEAEAEATTCSAVPRPRPSPRFPP